ncbi:sarcosine oxidase subunit beta family protein [Sediminicoccus sp. KRV36]|uniref:sarcosine oxidase subunit beta family protein n=1 Tax=Sediminicoccus sp. KRV36 TaxID=3133721 RepID=UPI00200C185F|nr:sarcosine oxidase subunit beta family protein [Sediminicoccus rosea]UPY36397.1 sarcosine oxidase subunit beta family protein [Sediminicoccus rosea]
MASYSGLRILTEGLTGNRGWKPAWRKPEPKPAYDAIVVGGGGHGLATAFYLASIHGITNVAVLERGPIGLGNTGRNTTIVRSNYLLPENHHFYEHSLKLWEGLEQSLGYNVMMSQRGVLNLYHSDAQRNAYTRRGNAMRLAGIDAELIGREEVAAMCPLIDLDNARFPVLGGLLQRRGGTARHDAVAWGFAHAADARGVDIIEHCEVTSMIIEGGAIQGVRTTRGEIRAPKVGLAVAGNTSVLCAMAGLTVPVESHLMQAFVSEGLKPLIDQVITFGAAHFYISQSDKGGLVFGGGLDGYNSYGQRGTLPEAEHIFAAGASLMPALKRVRALRSWAGVMDMTPDASPYICLTPIQGLTMTGGWNYGGFKATPGSGWCHAWTMAKQEPHRLNAAYTLTRFKEGRMLDEKGAGPFFWMQ